MYIIILHPIPNKNNEPTHNFKYIYLCNSLIHPCTSRYHTCARRCHWRWRAGSSATTSPRRTCASRRRPPCHLRQPCNSRHRHHRRPRRCRRTADNRRMSARVPRRRATASPSSRRPSSERLSRERANVWCFSSPVGLWFRYVVDLKMTFFLIGNLWLDKEFSCYVDLWVFVGGDLCFEEYGNIFEIIVNKLSSKYLRNGTKVIKIRIGNTKSIIFAQDICNRSLKNCTSMGR